MELTELLVIGGGPAGQAAALAAAAHGVQTVLVDEGPPPPTWLPRQIPHWYGERLPVTPPRPSPDPDPFSPLRRQGVDVRAGHACWGLFDGPVAGLYDGERTTLVQARRLVLATGSTDLPLAFPGWTLPGVLGGLAALDLLRDYGTLGGERVVVLGSGNLALTVAAAARAAGHTIVAVVEIENTPQGNAAALAALERDGADIVPGYTVAYARGDGKVEQIMLGGVNPDGARAQGQSFPVRADTLVVAVGRAPALELPFLLGCDVAFDAEAGGYVPVLDQTQQTTIPGVYVAGDAADASDARFPLPELAAAEGRIAGTAAAVALGKASAAEQVAALDALASYRTRLPAAPVHSLPRGGHLTPWHRTAALVTPGDIPICRCEGITRDMLFAAEPVVGAAVPDELKRYTRAGMGQCQGRCCRITIAGLLADRARTTLAAIPLAAWRPPVRPVPLAALATEDVPDVPLHPAFARVAAQLEADLAAGVIPAPRAAAARYKIDEENHRALAAGLDETAIAEAARLLTITLRHVTVH